MVILFCAFSLNSCKNKLDNLIMTEPSEYWVIDDEYNKNTYRSYAYKFNENSKYEMFVIRRNKKQIHPYSSGDIVYPDNKWEIFDDSIKIGNSKFKLNIINDSILFLKSKNYNERLLKVNYKEGYVKMKNSLN